MRLRQTQIDDDQVDLVQFHLHARDELVPIGDGHGTVARPFEHRLEAVANKGRIVGDDDDFGSDGCSGTHIFEYRYGKFATLDAGLVSFGVVRGLARLLVGRTRGVC